MRLQFLLAMRDDSCRFKLAPSSQVVIVTGLMDYLTRAPSKYTRAKMLSVGNSISPPGR